MAGNLSPQARAQLSTLAELNERVQHVYGLVELYATARANREQYLPAIARSFAQLRFKFMGMGMDDLSGLAASMTLAAKRGLSPTSKIRILRDGVGSMRFQMEMEQRAIVAADQEAQQKERDKADEADSLEATRAAKGEPMADQTDDDLELLASDEVEDALFDER